MADHAVVIGIEAYPGLNDLRGPCNDAGEFRKWLLKPEGGNVPEANIQPLLSNGLAQGAGVGGARPTLSELEVPFRPLVTRAAQGEHLGERLFVFAAGHGFADSQDINSAALFTANAEFLFPLHLAVMSYVTFLQRAWAFDEIIVIMDSCRSTNPLFEIGKPALPRIQPHANSGKVKMFVGFGAAFTEVTREREVDGVWRGIFTMAVIDALENATPNRLGRVTGSIIKDHVHNGISRFANGVKLAPVEIAMDTQKEVRLVTRNSGTKAVTFNVTTATGPCEVVVLFGGREEVHRENLVAPGAFQLPLEPGLYTACIPDTPTSKNFEIPLDDAVTL